jgi:hypothetical protein
MARSARSRAGAALRLPGVESAARIGLIARTGFYLVLAGLTAHVAADGAGGTQANENGALTVIASTGLGEVFIGVAAAGFLILGAVRIAAAIRDRKGSTGSRLTTGLQGAFYAALTVVPISFLAGSSSTGSEQSQHRETGEVLGFPGGRVIVAVVAVIVAAVALWQVKNAVRTDFLEGLRIPRRPSWLRPAVVWSGRAGIAARGLVFLPIAGFLMAAAVDANPGQADGLDAELGALAREPWGPAALAVVTAGLVTFAVYSGFEAAFRDLTSDE